MKSPLDFIKEVEENYNVHTIECNKVKVWQILRLNYISAFEKNLAPLNTHEVKSKNPTQSRVQSIMLNLSNAFWQGHNYFKSYDYLLFTDILEERIIDNKISDKISHNIIKLLNKDLLVIINPQKSKHKKIKDYYHKNYLTEAIFHLNSRLKKYTGKDIYIENEEILKTVEKEYKVNVDYVNIIREFFYLVDVLDRYFKRCKPKKIFVNCYYGLFHQAIIYSAHKNNIQVIELQHGIINSEHYAYNIFTPIGKETFPDYIYTFGDYVKEYITSNFIEEKNKIPVGNFYIEYCKNKCSGDKSLITYFKELREKYSKIVVITSQITIEEELIQFLLQAAHMSRDTLFIFIPRFYDKDFSTYNFPENIIIHKEIDFYQTVGFCDFHSTVYSSCALEAPRFGTPNILININNLSKMNLDNILKDLEFNKYVSSASDFVNTIKEWETPSKEEIINLSETLYKSNNLENLKKALYG